MSHWLTAIKCTHDSFFRHLKENVEPAQAAASLAKLLPLLPQTSDNTLVLVLDAIQSSLKVGGAVMDQTTCSALIKTVLETWFATPEGAPPCVVLHPAESDLLSAPDPLLGSSIADLFASLSASPSPIVQSSLQNEALPALVSTMTEIRSDPSSIRAAAALDISNSIFSRFPTPLPAGAFARIADILFEMLTTTEDRDIIQTGLGVVTTVIRKDVDQLLSWSVLP